MFYKSNEELPEELKQSLSAEDQNLYRDVFNHAYKQDIDPKSSRGSESQKDAAHVIAWEAVKQN